MDYQTSILLALVIIPAFLAHAYYRWRSDPLRRLRGPDSPSILYGGYHRYLILYRSSLVKQEMNLPSSAKRKWGITSSNGRVNMATSGECMAALV